jgi:hypothetical protein
MGRMALYLIFATSFLMGTEPNDVETYRQKIKSLDESGKRQVLIIHKLREENKLLKEEVEKLKKENLNLKILCEQHGKFYGIKNEDYAQKVNMDFRKSVDVNEIGYITTVKIVKVLDKENMIVQLRRKGHLLNSAYSGGTGSAEQYNPALEPPYGKEPTLLYDYDYDYDICFCFKGIDTTKYIDGQEISLRKIFKITGTKTIEELGGIKVFVLELYDDKRSN